MTEATEIALIGATSTTVVAILGLGANVWLTLSERRNSQKTQEADREARQQERREDIEEWYRRTLFERRIAAIHKATAWMLQLQRSRSEVMKKQTREIRDEHFALCQSARNWLGENSIYLYGKATEQSHFAGFLGWVGMEDDDRAYWDSVQSASDELNILTTEILRNPHAVRPSAASDPQHA